MGFTLGLIVGFVGGVAAASVPAVRGFIYGVWDSAKAAARRRGWL